MIECVLLTVEWFSRGFAILLYKKCNVFVRIQYINVGGFEGTAANN